MTDSELVRIQVSAAILYLTKRKDEYVLDWRACKFWRKTVGDYSVIVLESVKKVI